MVSHRYSSLLTLAVALCAVQGARIRHHRGNYTAHVGVSEISVVEKHGRLSVQGNKIVDKTGAPLRLRGMSLFWSQWQGQYWNANAVKWLKNDWHVTVIRAAMGIEQGGYLENSWAEKARMEAVVDACIAAGIYVVIDWHDHHAEQHTEQAKGFFSEMARKYGGYPNVLFELYNEPVHQSWSGTIKPYYEAVIPVIRQHTNNIIILGTRLWSQEVDEASRDRVWGDNLAYTVHFYANTHRQSLRNKVSAALANGVAIFATEWGTCDASGDGTLDLGETQAWLNFFAQHHISDANWAVSDKSEACSALRPGSSGNGGWSESQLTDSGRFVRASIRGDSTGVGPEPSGGCCKFGADCGDCGVDGTGWCHESASNCAQCIGSFDSSTSAPQCFGNPNPGNPGGCCKFGNDCGDCGNDGSGWCHQSSSNCAACDGSFDGSSPSPQCS
jgi:endoglucanase